MPPQRTAINRRIRKKNETERECMRISSFPWPWLRQQTGVRLHELCVTNAPGTEVLQEERADISATPKMGIQREEILLKLRMPNDFEENVSPYGVEYAARICDRVLRVFNWMRLAATRF